MESDDVAETDLLTVGEAAQILQVTTKTLQRWDQEGKLPAGRTLGGRRRYLRSDVTAVAEKMRGEDKAAS